MFFFLGRKLKTHNDESFFFCYCYVMCYIYRHVPVVPTGIILYYNNDIISNDLHFSLRRCSLREPQTLIASLSPPTPLIPACDITYKIYIYTYANQYILLLFPTIYYIDPKGNFIMNLNSFASSYRMNNYFWSVTHVPRLLHQIVYYCHTLIHYIILSFQES